MRNSITIVREIKAPIERVFDAFITPEDLVKWHHAGGGWSTPYAEVNPEVGGLIKIAYANEKGIVEFDLLAVIEEVTRPTRIAYHLQLEQFVKDDNRLITIDLQDLNNATQVTVEIDLENINSAELQRQGWTEHIDNLQRLLEQ
jgi:uncharacterized protein YndB with AHSA1/START domain